jgi:hypothetical protein
LEPLAEVDDVLEADIVPDSERPPTAVAAEDLLSVTVPLTALAPVAVVESALVVDIVPDIALVPDAVVADECEAEAVPLNAGAEGTGAFRAM